MEERCWGEVLGREVEGMQQLVLIATRETTTDENKGRRGGNTDTDAYVGWAEEGVVEERCWGGKSRGCCEVPRGGGGGGTSLLGYRIDL